MRILRWCVHLGALRRSSQSHNLKDLTQVFNAQIKAYLRPMGVPHFYSQQWPSPLEVSLHRTQAKCSSQTLGWIGINSSRTLSLSRLRTSPYLGFLSSIQISRNPGTIAPNLGNTATISATMTHSHGTLADISEPPQPHDVIRKILPHTYHIGSNTSAI